MKHDRRIRRRLTKLGLPRLELYDGSLSARDFARVVAVVDKLIDDAQVEVLRALQESRITLAELVDLDRKGQLAGASILTSLVLARLLWSTWETFEASAAKSPKTSLRYATTRRALQARAGEWLGPKATVLELRSVPWSELAHRWRRDRSGSDWNHVRRGVSRFLQSLSAISIIRSAAKSSRGSRFIANA